MTSYIRGFEDLGKDDVAVAGGKGANLGELSRAGFPVPAGFVLTTAAYDAFVTANGITDTIVGLATLPPDVQPEAYDHAAEQIRALFTTGDIPGDMVRELRTALSSLAPGGNVALAVRSSATAEDLEGASFAGQQDTYLNVRGPDALLAAVRECWASLWTARAMAYRARQGIDPATVRLAVAVQEMVSADAAGVMFTANPTNGHRDEAVISAAWGLGESVVSGAVTTDDLVVDKLIGQIRSRTTGDKAVMTVPTDTGTAQSPVPAQRRTEPVLDDKAAATLVELGVQIEQHYGAPQDIEWAREGGEFFVVQSRPITALPEPETEPPTDWPVPDPKDAYFRASIVEQLPDPLSPLFADLIDPSVARSLSALMREFLGRGAPRDGEVGLPTINGYAYYRYSRAAFGRLMLVSPAMLKVFTSDGQQGALARWRDRVHPRYARIVADWTARPLEDLSDAQLLAGVVELLDAGTEYYTAVQVIIPLAASSEVIFTRFYERMVRRAGDPPAATFLLGFDSAPIRAEKSLYDLATWTRTHDEITATLLATPSARAGELLRGGSFSPAWDEWRARFQAHLERFGHTTYNLDFLNPTPADDPAPLFDALRFYLDGGGMNPHERQARSAARRDELTADVLARLDTARHAVFARLLRWAQSIAPVREDALADIGLAWPQMRRMLAELGRRRAAAGVIERPEDVYWLHPDEVVGQADLPEGAVVQRQALWRGQRRVTPPQMLPKGTIFDHLESWMPAVSGEQTGPVLRGIGASAGKITAPARVLAGPADFHRMRPGDVLVAGITTPAWTSLFAMASAVVTDIGGPLSHSSIVAREYGIPAVLGTGVATRRISDGESILVDGDAGTVTLLQEVDATAPKPDATPRLGRRLAGVAAVSGGLAVGVAAWRKRRTRI